MAHTRNWNTAYEAIPPNTQAAQEGAERIRDLKTDVRERLDLDHIMDEDTTNDGRHRWVALVEQAGDPSNLADKGFLYTKEVDSLTELFYEDDAGTVFQITDNGKLLLLDTNNLWTAGQGVSEVIVAYSSPLTLDAALGNNFVVGALTGNLQLNPPSNPKAGQVLSIRLIQDGTGSRLLTFGTTIYGNTALDWALSTGASDVDKLVLEYDATSTRWRALALHKDINNAL